MYSKYQKLTRTKNINQPKHGEPNMKYFKETEKAVQVTMSIDYYLTEHTVNLKVWIPKSQMRNGKLSSWIADAKLSDYARGKAFADFFDAEGTLIEVEKKSSARCSKDAKEFSAEINRTFGKLRFA